MLNTEEDNRKRKIDTLVASYLSGNKQQTQQPKMLQLPGGVTLYQGGINCTNSQHVHYHGIEASTPSK